MNRAQGSFPPDAPKETHSNNINRTANGHTRNDRIPIASHKSPGYMQAQVKSVNDENPFVVEPCSWEPPSITSTILSKIMEEKSVSAMKEKVGSLPCLLNLLNSDPKTGLNENSLNINKRFGENKLPTVLPKSFLALVWEASQDKTLIMLMIAAIISLSIATYRLLFSKDSTSVELLEGAAILLAVISVIILSSINDWFKDQKFQSLRDQNSDRQVRCLRNGKEQKTSIFHLLVGDILLLEAGDIIAADGLLLDGHSLLINESSITGESKPVRKDPTSNNIFMFSGTIVLEGIGKMVVIAVGSLSTQGKIMASMAATTTATAPTPLQQQLYALSEKIAYFGLVAAGLLFLALLLKLLLLGNLRQNPSQFFQALTDVLIEAITILVVAVPEGLPMAVTLTLAFASSRMSTENNLVRILSACETMGSATTICTDKTGTLTTNMMNVVGGVLFGIPFGSPGLIDAQINTGSCTVVENNQDSISGLSYLSAVMDSHPEELNLLLDTIVLNSTAVVGGAGSPIGSSTEIALLQLLQQMGIEDPCSLRSKYRIIDMVPFSSERKMMRTVVETQDSTILTFLKGAPEIVTASCSTQFNFDSTIGIINKILLDESSIRAIQWRLASQGLRTIALAALAGRLLDDSNNGYTLLGLVGIEDPLRSDVPAAVTTCQKAGISVRMVTGDALETASAIARKAGVLMRGGLAIEGPRFRSLDEATLLKIVPRLQVLARSSPLDKEILVSKLRLLGDVVAVTGDGTNDGPALRAAHVGFSMGITGTEVAKEASSIILMDDQFSSIVKAVGWGRCIGDAVRKFLIFQLTVNISAVVVAFISSMVDPSGYGVFNALQLLWVNLLMDTMGALALATDRPHPELLERKPEGLARQLVTPGMWVRILGMASFQVVTLSILIFFIPQNFIGSLESAVGRGPATFIFNTFVMMQLWNEVLCRSLPPLPGESEMIKNPFLNLLENKIFLAVLVFSITGQILIVQVGGVIFKTVPLTLGKWCWCIMIGGLSVPLFYLLNRLAVYANNLFQPERMESTMASRERLRWHATVTDVKNGLSVFSTLRRARPLFSD